MGMIYLDSCILIDATSVSTARGQRARDELKGAADQIDLVTSPLVDLECMIRPIRLKNDRAIAAIRDALRRFRHLAVTTRAYELAAHLRAIHGLAIPDALHLATASLGGCDALWTSDRDLLRAAPGFAIDPLSDH